MHTSVLADIKVVDVSLVEQEDQDIANPILDIKLRNIGSEVAFLKYLEFKTIHHWDLKSDHHPSLKNVSAQYDITLIEKAGTSVRHKISHEVKPQETERIQVRLSTDYHGDPLGLSIFLLDASIIFNETNSRAGIGQLLLDVKPPAIVQGSYFPGYSSKTIAHNKAVVTEIFALPYSYVVAEERIFGALESWRFAPDE